MWVSSICLVIRGSALRRMACSLQRPHDILTEVGLNIFLLTLSCHKENILGRVALSGGVSGRTSQSIKFMNRRDARSDIENLELVKGEAAVLYHHTDLQLHL